MAHHHDLTNDEYDDDNLQTDTYVISRTKNHIAMQLLILQVTTDLYKKNTNNPYQQTTSNTTSSA